MIYYYLCTLFIKPNKITNNMKTEYEKPKTKVVLLQGQHHLLETSGNGMSVDMSGYQKGGNGSDESDGWTD